MKHISIVAKFLLIMACFGLFSLGVAVYSGIQIASVDEDYAGLMEGESTAALYLARSNRNLQAARASIGNC